MKQKLHPQDAKHQKNEEPTQSAQRSTFTEVSELHPLLQIQQTLGNRVMQKVLAGTRGQTSYPLSREAASALRRETSFFPPNVVSSAPMTIGLVQRKGTGQGRNGRVIVRRAAVEYYDVEGSTLEEVSAQLDPDEWGRCTYNYDYTYTTDENGQTTHVDVTVTTTIRLPRQRGAGWRQASRAAKREWNRMIRALQTHENGHRRIAEKRASIVREGLLGQAEGDVQTKFEELRGQVQDEFDQYDADTSHGQTQGVSLDISIQ